MAAYVAATARVEVEEGEWSGWWRHVLLQNVREPEKKLRESWTLLWSLQTERRISFEIQFFSK